MTKTTAEAADTAGWHILVSAAGDDLGRDVYAVKPCTVACPAGDQPRQEDQPPLSLIHI